MPRDVKELIPPSADDHSNVEAQNKRQWNEVGKPLTVDCNMLKHSAQQQPCDTLIHAFAANKQTVVLVVQQFSVGLVIERSLVRLPAGALSSQLGQLSLPSLRGR